LVVGWFRLVVFICGTIVVSEGCRISLVGAEPSTVVASRVDFGRYRSIRCRSYSGRMDEDVGCDRAGIELLRRPVIAAVLMSGVVSLVVLTIIGGPHTNRTGSLLSLDIAVGVISCALLPVLLRWPVAGGLALGVLAGLSPAATPAATAAVLIVAQQRRFRLAGAIAAVGVAGHAVQGLWRPASGLSYVWWLTLTIAAYAALLGWGEWMQARRVLVASLRDRAHRAEAEQGRRVAEARISERARIAGEMHDVLAHRLSLVATYAGALEYRPDSPPEQLARAAGLVRDGVHQARMSRVPWNFGSGPMIIRLRSRSHHDGRHRQSARRHAAGGRLAALAGAGGR
jgi:hypothetical protein